MSHRTREGIFLPKSALKVLLVVLATSVYYSPTLSPALSAPKLNFFVPSFFQIFQAVVQIRQVQLIIHYQQLQSLE